MQILATITDGTVSLAPRHPISASIGACTPGLGRTSLIGAIGRHLEDAVLVLVAVLFLPVGILLIGTPIALCARLVFEIVRRL